MSLYDKAKVFFSAAAGAGNDEVAYNIKPVEKLKVDEHVTNGTFNTPIGNTWEGSSNVTFSNNSAVVTSLSGGSDSVYQNNVFEVGKTYKVSFELELRAGAVKVGDGGEGQSNKVGVFQTSGKHSAYHTVADTAANPHRLIFARNTSSGYDFTVSNVSVREVEQKANDFSFVRGSDLTATHEGADGLIKKTRQNLLQYSNGFDNALWVGHTSGSTRIDTVTGGQAGYDGSNNAFLLNKDSSDLFKRREQIVAETAGVATFSVYAKAGTASSISLRGGSDDGANVQNGNDDRADFNLANGTSSIIENAVTSSMEAITGSAGDTDRWYRCSVVFKDPTQLVQIYVNFNSASTGTVFVQNAQLEAGLVATPYIDRTGAAYSTAGVLENEPRYDYSGGDATLLLEPERQNVVDHSEYLGAWSFSGNANSVFSFTQNHSISPDGTKNASKYSATANYRSIRRIVTLETSTNYVFSFYVKNIDATRARYRVFNTDTGSGSGADVIAATNYFSSVSTSQWTRIEVPFTTDAVGTSYGLYLADGLTVTNSGDSGGNILFWGAQVEKGSYATSYIPTYGSAATRSNDNAIIKDINAGTSYTVLFDFDATSNLDTNTILYYFFDDNDKVDQSDAIFTPRWYKTGAENDSFRIYDQEGLAYPITSEYTSTTKKWVMRVDGTSFDLFRDNAGTPQKITGSALSGARFLQKISIRPNRQLIKQLIIFDSALTDPECVSLTTI